VNVVFVVKASDSPEPLKIPPLLQFTDVVQPVGASPVYPQVRVLLAPFTTGDVTESVAVTGSTQIVPLEAVPKAHTPVAEAVAVTLLPFAESVYVLTPIKTSTTCVPERDVESTAPPAFVNLAVVAFVVANVAVAVHLPRPADTVHVAGATDNVPVGVTTGGVVGVVDPPPPPPPQATSAMVIPMSATAVVKRPRVDAKNFFIVGSFLAKKPCFSVEFERELMEGVCVKALNRFKTLTKNTKPPFHIILFLIDFVKFLISLYLWSRIVS
jgi:hypothetical protein